MSFIEQNFSRFAFFRFFGEKKGKTFIIFLASLVGCLFFSVSASVLHIIAIKTYFGSGAYITRLLNGKWISSHEEKFLRCRRHLMRFRWRKKGYSCALVNAWRRKVSCKIYSIELLAIPASARFHLVIECKLKNWSLSYFFFFFLSHLNAKICLSLLNVSLSTPGACYGK